MLKQLTLILAIVFVALLAIVAAMTIINRDDDEPDLESDPVEQDAAAETVTLSVGSDGSPLEIGCRLPVDGQSPLLVTFENGTGVVDDFQARIVVALTDGTTSSLLADAPDLRPDERRSVLPEPWLDPALVADCEVVAIEASDRVILVESN